MATKNSLNKAAEAVTARFFSRADEDQQDVVENPSESRQEGRQAVGSSKVSAEPEKAVRGRKKTVSEPMKVFSFRGTVQDVDQWRLYASIRGVKVDEIGAAAMREYLKRHPLSSEEKALFDKRIENMKS